MPGIVVAVDQPLALNISRRTFLTQATAAAAALTLPQIARGAPGRPTTASSAGINTHWLRADQPDRQRWLRDCKGLTVRESISWGVVEPDFDVWDWTL